MFTPSRLSLARRRRGMTLVALSRAIGNAVKPRTLSAYERGDNVPTEDTLERLALALNFPRSFFDAPELADASVDGVSFRALTRMTAAQRDRSIAAGTFIIDVNNWITQRLNLPELDVPEILPAVMDPETAAKSVRASWGLGEHPIPNMVHLLEAHGIRVYSLCEDCEEVDAFSFWQDGTPFVCLNTNKTAEHSRFDSAHELGHLVMHRYGGKPSGRAEEHEANRFASAFLMPEADIRASGPSFPSFDALVESKKRWNVSVAALNYRLFKLDLISEWHYRELCIDVSRYGRKREPDPSPREHSLVLAKAFRLLREDGIARRDVAAQLNIHVEDLEALIFGLVLSAIEGSASDMPEPATPPERRLRSV
jgi:Zn-dependent peptidase ImmA (M78 family)